MSAFLDEDDDKRDELDIDIDIDRLVASEPPPPVRRIDLRPILAGLLVLILGGGLGTAAYFASSLDMGEVIGVLDVADKGPRLSMDMPGRQPDAPPPAPVPAGDGPLLAPPGAPPAEAPAAAAHGEAAHEASPPPEAPAIAAKPPEPAPPRFPDAPKPRGDAKPPTYDGLPEMKEEVTPLKPAPDDMMLRNTGVGPLPIIALDGRQPWREYAAPFDAPANRNRLAVIVSGLGLDRDATEAAIARLPPQVTLSFSPYAPALDKWLRQARAAGHEVMLDLPAEPSGFPAVDPGPMALLTSINGDENVATLERVLARMPGHVGVLANDGPFVRSPASLAPVLGALRERGLLYVGFSAAEGDTPAHAPVTEVIDTDPFREAIDARLDRALAEARANGRAVAVASSAKPVTLDRIANLVHRLNGVLLAPATAVATPPTAGGKS